MKVSIQLNFYGCKIFFFGEICAIVAANVFLKIIFLLQFFWYFFLLYSIFIKQFLEIIFYSQN